MNDRYPDLKAFHTSKALARAERDRTREQLARRWAVVHDPRTRGALLRDAVGDALRSWTPYKRVHDLLHGRVPGSMVAAVGMAVASAQRGMGRRLLFSGLSMALGKVIGDARPEGEGLLSRVASAIGRGVRFIHERRAERQERVQHDASTQERP